MNSNAFFEILRQAGPEAAMPVGAPEAIERQEGQWHVLPLEGTFEIVYEDSRGIWSTRRVEARELKLGPGRTLLGGIDRNRGGYRGFRADRIRRLTDPASATRIEAGILDWLLARAQVQRRERVALRRSLVQTARKRPPNPGPVAA
jgi:hypothetical protein